MAFADLTLLLLGYVRPIVAPVDVQSRVPNPRPAEFIQIRRVGGRAVEPVRELVRVDIRVWAQREPRAMELLLAFRAAVWALNGTTLLDPAVPVYDVAEFTGPQSVDDNLTDTPQAFMTFELVVRADDVTHPAPTVP